MGNIFGYHCDRNQEALLENPPPDSLKKNSSSIHYNNNNVEASLPNLQQRSSSHDEEEAKIPIPEPSTQYERELHQFVVRSVNLKKGKDDFDHNYNPNIKNTLVLDTQDYPMKTSRLINEIKILARNLPVTLSNSIFVVYDDSRMDIMKAAITGAEDTPYAHGIFIFDIYCDENFPAGPPKMNLMTTGGNKVRFNPNLYNNGYICLSLLGTWAGDPIEKWGAKSHILQILLSIQAIVMSEGVIYNEPGHQNDGNTDVGRARNRGYSNIVKLMNIRHAMIGMMKNPPAAFAEVIKGHFKYKREKIIETCEKWVAEEKEGKEALYDGLVDLHNKEWATRYKAEPEKFWGDLAAEVQELKKELNKISGTE